MTFTSNPPSRPGFYAWKKDDNSAPVALTVWKSRTGKRLLAEGPAIDWPVDIMHSGLWCPLFPADELEKALMEGMGIIHTDYASEGTEQYWLQSNTIKLG